MSVACKQGATGTSIPLRNGKRGSGQGGHTGARADIVDARAQLVFMC